MRRFVINNVIFIFFIIITTIDTSRIFYLPVPKIHSSQYDVKLTSNVQESDEKIDEQRSIMDEYFLPLRLIEHNFYGKRHKSQSNILKNLGTGGLNELDNEKSISRQYADFDGLPSDRRSNQFKSSYVETQDLRTLLTNDQESNAAMEQLANVNNNNNNGFQGQWPKDEAQVQAERLQATDFIDNIEQKQRRNDVIFLVLVGVCSLVGILGLISAAIFWYKIQKRAEATLDAEYPSYGITGPTSASKISPNSTASDRKLAQSAQMFHYQQQRQQMMAQEKANLESKPVQSDDEDDEGTGDGDRTVYECPGLAPTGEMEVRNPLFVEPESPLTAPPFASHPTTNNHYPQPTTTSPSSSPSKEKFLS